VRAQSRAARVLAYLVLFVVHRIALAVLGLGGRARLAARLLLGSRRGGGGFGRAPNAQLAEIVSSKPCASMRSILLESATCSIMASMRSTEALMC
jgi:hypothetical protein